MLPSANAEMTPSETSNHDSELGQDAATETEAVATAPATVDTKNKNRLPEIPIAERAVINSQNDLDQVLAAHKRWVEAVLDPNVEVASGRANLQGLDLRGYQLAGANLSGANLAQCILTSSDLSRVNFTVANLQGAQLQDANLQGAKLTRAKLEGADLRGADLTGANLTGADLSKCILKSEQLPSSAGAAKRAGASARPATDREADADATTAADATAAADETATIAAAEATEEESNSEQPNLAHATETVPSSTIEQVAL